MKSEQLLATPSCIRTSSASVVSKTFEVRTVPRTVPRIAPGEYGELVGLALFGLKKNFFRPEKKEKARPFAQRKDFLRFRVGFCSKKTGNRRKKTSSPLPRSKNRGASPIGQWQPPRTPAMHNEPGRHAPRSPQPRTLARSPATISPLVPSPWEQAQRRVCHHVVHLAAFRGFRLLASWLRGFALSATVAVRSR